MSWPRCASGSSPRGRGKLVPALLVQVLDGLIPAGAGKTRPRRVARWRARAHPRGGGENVDDGDQPIPRTGSSPRGRGKRLLTARGARRTRLIPAGAGKTAWRAWFWGPQCGSSPRGRGKPHPGSPGRRNRRLIPAGAGKTVERDSLGWTTAAHPRGGGENRSRRSPRLRPRGSSPRGRGKLGCAHRAVDGLRLIPAWAGKTTHANLAEYNQGAHPRVGGENSPPGGATVSSEGSSPRGRGKPQLTIKDSQLWRLIPAWAGKTAP